MAHTPGPWYVSRDFEVLSDNDEVMDGYIADVISKNGNYTDEDEQERMANARLIAAAPTLLKALEDAPVIRLNETLEEFQVRYQEWFHSKQIAIAQAKGDEIVI